MAKIFFLFLLIVFIYAHNESKTIPPPKQLSVLNCLPGFPPNSVGDYIMTDNNYTKLIKKHKLLVVIGSANWCKACCKHEELFYKLKHFYLNDNKINPYANDTAIARLDFASEASTDIDSKFRIMRVPYIIVYKDAKPYKYQHILDISRIVRFINRIHRPMMRVKTLDQLEKFLNRTEKDYEGDLINTIKVFGFFFDPEETIEDREEFERAAQNLLERNEIYFAMMTNPKEIKKAKQKFKEQWFEDYTLTSVVIQHFPGRYQIIDISDLVLKLKKLSTAIETNVINLVGEYKMEQHNIFEEKKKPILIFVIDSFVKVEESRKFLRMAEEVAKIYFEKVYFAWVDGNLNIQRKQMLGIEHEVVPTMAWMRIDYETKISYPPDWPINIESIKEFINDYLNLPLMTMILKYDANQRKLKKNTLYNYLTDVAELNATTFEEVRQEGHDLVILFFESRRDHQFIDMALNFNHLAKRFRDFNMNNVKVCIYDLYYNQMPDLPNTNPYVPFIFYLPSGIHHQYYTIYNGEMKAEKIMEFIAQNSLGKIILPEYPHIPEEYLDEYLSELMTAEKFDDSKYLKRVKEDL